MKYIVIYADGRKTRPLEKEEAVGLYESFDDAVTLAKVLLQKGQECQ